MYGWREAVQKEGRAAGKTKDAMAQALVELLSSGHPLGKVRVKQVTDLCGVDRQTFYYYFKNIADLVQYTYECEVAKMLAASSVEDMRQINWKTRIYSALKLIQDNPGLRKMITPSLSDHTLRLELRRVVHSELEATVKEHLLEAGMDEELARDRVMYLSYMLESVLMSWLANDIDVEPMLVLDHIEEMLIDYTSGVAARLKG